MQRGIGRVLWVSHRHMSKAICSCILAKRCISGCSQIGSNFNMPKPTAKGLAPHTSPNECCWFEIMILGRSSSLRFITIFTKSNTKNTTTCHLIHTKCRIAWTTYPRKVRSLSRHIGALKNTGSVEYSSSSSPLSQDQHCLLSSFFVLDLYSYVFVNLKNLVDNQQSTYN